MPAMGSSCHFLTIQISFFQNSIALIILKNPLEHFEYVILFLLVLETIA